jgi:hypothetical protein
MKTALQCLLKQIEDKNGKEFTSYYSEFINDALEKEKEQIIDSYYGNIDGVYGYREAGEEYYNQTYNQNK